MYKQGALLFSFRVTGALILFFANVYIASEFGAETYGELAYLLSLSTLFSFLVCGGMDVHLKKHSAMHTEKNSSLDIHRQSLIVCLLILSIAALPLWFALTTNFNLENTIKLFPILLITTYLLAQQKIISGLLIGQEKPVYDSIFGRILQPTLFTIFSLLAVYSSFKYFNIDIAHLTLSYSFSLLVALLLAVNLAYKSKSSTGKCKSDKLNLSCWNVYAGLIKKSAPFAFLSAATIVERNIDVLMLSWLASNIETGIYYACTRVSSLFLLALFAMNAVASPIVTRANLNNDINKLQNTIYKVTIASSLVSVVLLLMVLVFGKDILALFEFNSNKAYVGLIILSVGNFIRTLLGPVFMIATMTGLEKYALRVSALSVIVNIILNFILIPFLGLIGAAAATIISRVARSIIMGRKIKLEMGVKSGFLPI